MYFLQCAVLVNVQQGVSQLNLMLRGGGGDILDIRFAYVPSTLIVYYRLIYVVGFNYVELLI